MEDYSIYNYTIETKVRKAQYNHVKCDETIRFSTGGQPLELVKKSGMKRVASGDDKQLTHAHANRIMTENGLSGNK